MVRVLTYLLVIAALAAGAVWLADRPGEVSVLWQGYRIETSVAMAGRPSSSARSTACVVPKDAGIRMPVSVSLIASAQYL